MNLKDRMIVDTYRKRRNSYVAMGDAAHQRLESLIKESGIEIFGIEHRVKSESSLIGKLNLRGEGFHKLEDLTDILGARIICYFADDVDRVGKLIEQAFDVDHKRSKDKRALIRVDSFGYLSVHYICALPHDAGYPDDICGIYFEIQVRTILQHTWAAINHDMGYKSEFGVPRVVGRELSRIAGLLELADDEFVRVRNTMHAYTSEIREKIANNTAHDVLIDTLSLQEYVATNSRMTEFMAKLAEISGAEISEISPEPYIHQLKWLKKQTLGDLSQMLEDNWELALALAKHSLEAAELDILSSNVGLRFLCRAELYNKKYTEEQAAEFLKMSFNDEARAARQAAHLFRTCNSLTE
ncbi:MAG: hypothetical protein IJ486_06730 [Firmicutes bacterium]|nr:hypothetical protein [Bacillota bacterium]